jgi:hypothetical protein
MSFIREAHDWKVDVFSSVFEALHSVKVRRGLEDKMWWVSSKKKVCSRSSPSFTHWLALEVVAFPGKVFGALRLFQELLF